MSLVSTQPPFADLVPDFIFHALEHCGLEPDGRILALNSFENRVYQVGLEDQPPEQAFIVVKFYRPDRWSDEQINEEHRFCFELVQQELPIVAPLSFAQLKALGLSQHSGSAAAEGDSLFSYQGMRFALYLRVGGRAPEIEGCDVLTRLGHLIGRIHAVGAKSSYRHRPTLSYDFSETKSLVERQFLPPDLVSAYSSILTDLEHAIQARLDQVGPVQVIRAHGDCHLGNILLRDQQLWLLDLDDSKMMPAVQDLWLLLSGDRFTRQQQLADVIRAYRQFYDFNLAELGLIEVLQTLRMINYAGWLAARWHDPAFQHSFPWFNSPRYWSEHVLSLREQLAEFMHPPVVVEL